MLKEALQYIVNLSTPTVREIDGETYSDKNLVRIKHNPKAEPIEMSTLTSLIAYLKSGIDVNTEKEKWFIHVQSPTKVSVFSALDDERSRECLIRVNAPVPTFNFGQFIDHESFCIALQSKFLPSEDLSKLLKVAGTVEAGSVSEYGDDGVSQKATVKTGIASKGDVIVPNPVSLAPFRTFAEVAQTESDFVFRMKQDKYDDILCALFEADGGAWKNEAMMRIRGYLEDALSFCGAFIVIS